MRGVSDSRWIPPSTTLSSHNKIQVSPTTYLLTFTRLSRAPNKPSVSTLRNQVTWTRHMSLTPLKLHQSNSLWSAATILSWHFISSLFLLRLLLFLVIIVLSSSPFLLVPFTISDLDKLLLSFLQGTVKH